MSTMSLPEIKNLIRAGEVCKAESELKKILGRDPDNVQAKLLYGMCRQFGGDDETFLRIHDELVPRMALETDRELVSVWKKYRKLWLYLTAGLLVLGGVSAAVWQCVKSSPLVAAMRGRTVYAGPTAETLEKRDGQIFGNEGSVEIVGQ